MKFINGSGEEIPETAVKVLNEMVDRYKKIIFNMNIELEKIQDELNSIEIIKG